MEFSH